MFNLFSFNMFRFSSILILLFTIGLLVGLVGCSHKKTNRGHLFRCDWAFEYNRTPWVGCPPDSGCSNDENNCSNESCEKCSSEKKGVLDFFKKGNDHDCSCENHKKNKGFRRHCGLTPECTAKNPCCRTLGCGMWIDPADPNSFAGIGNGAKACGLTPFCSPMKPCGLTPNCGRVVNPNYMNQQMLMLGNNGMVLSGATTAPSTMLPNNPAIPHTPTIPTPVPPKKTIETPPIQPTTPKTPVLAGPNGLLISMGIVPGVSTITTGGVVAAAGVATPVGIMTPSGVQLPNGVVNHNAVIKACAMHPGCTAARPCGMTPGCGMMVPVAMVSNNAVQLASALQIPGVAGGIVQAGGMPVGIANNYANNYFAYPMLNQPVNGLTMSGFAQTGYPPIGYAPNGYSRHNRLAAETGLINAKENDDEEEEEQSEENETEIKSPMPLPRFHPLPTKPVFQRSEGLPVLPRNSNNNGNNKSLTVPKKTSTRTNTRTSMNTTIGESASDKSIVSNSTRIFSEEALNEAMEQAYLEGMSAAMEEVGEELDMRSDKLIAQPIIRQEDSEKANMQEKILEQAQKLQMKIEKQKEFELQSYQNELRKEARRIAAQTTEEQAIREQAIREEAAREMAIRERVIREEAAREIAAQEQAMKIQLAQQNQLAKQNMGYVMPPNQQMLQQTIPFNNMPNTMTNIMPNMGTVNTTPMSGLGFLQSAKSTGTNLLSTVTGILSPFSGLLGSEVPNVRTQGQVLSRSVPVGQQIITQQIPASQPVSQPVSRSGTVAQKTTQKTAQNIRQTNMLSKNTTQNAPRNPTAPPKIPIPQLPGKSSLQYYSDDQESLSEQDLSAYHNNSANNSANKSLAKNKQVPFSVSQKTSEKESGVFMQELPQKPPTKAKTIPKPQRIINADHEEESSMIHQVNFVDR
ncbi:MAG: trichohyalin-plectin-homology domain domain-containing protein [Planctomycetaceae bacterium]|nr:trichohyalin-plectin-homology domain domain-containing protein [Planctomycetaceae bacterium]